MVRGDMRRAQCVAIGAVWIVSFSYGRGQLENRLNSRNEATYLQETMPFHHFAPAPSGAYRSPRDIEARDSYLHQILNPILSKEESLLKAPGSMKLATRPSSDRNEVGTYETSEHTEVSRTGAFELNVVATDSEQRNVTTASFPPYEEYNEASVHYAAAPASEFATKMTVVIPSWDAATTGTISSQPISVASPKLPATGDSDPQPSASDWYATFFPVENRTEKPPVVKTTLPPMGIKPPSHCICEQPPPCVLPTLPPGVTPSAVPTLPPGVMPTLVPGDGWTPTFPPGITPTVWPTNPVPTLPPGITPTLLPGWEPTLPPETIPTFNPTLPPGVMPTVPPVVFPTSLPGVLPTPPPWLIPSLCPSEAPTLTPTVPPEVMPTLPPIVFPTLPPGVTPTLPPGWIPTLPPGVTPTVIPGWCSPPPPCRCPEIPSCPPGGGYMPVEPPLIALPTVPPAILTPPPTGGDFDPVYTPAPWFPTEVIPTEEPWVPMFPTLPPIIPTRPPGCACDEVVCLTERPVVVEITTTAAPCRCNPCVFEEPEEGVYPTFPPTIPTKTPSCTCGDAVGLTERSVLAEVTTTTAPRPRSSCASEEPFNPVNKDSGIPWQMISTDYVTTNRVNGSPRKPSGVGTRQSVDSANSATVGGNGATGCPNSSTATMVAIRTTETTEPPPTTTAAAVTAAAVPTKSIGTGAIDFTQRSMYYAVPLTISGKQTGLSWVGANIRDQMNGTLEFAPATTTATVPPCPWSTVLAKQRGANVTSDRSIARATDTGSCTGAVDDGGRTTTSTTPEAIDGNITGVVYKGGLEGTMKGIVSGTVSWKQNATVNGTSSVSGVPEHFSPCFTVATASEVAQARRDGWGFLATPDAVPGVTEPVGSASNVGQDGAQGSGVCADASEKKSSPGATLVRGSSFKKTAAAIASASVAGRPRVTQLPVQPIYATRPSLSEHQAMLVQQENVAKQAQALAEASSRQPNVVTERRRTGFSYELTSVKAV